jgi:hypothetical protein
MRHRFYGFESAVDLDEIDTVTIDPISNRSDGAIEVVITTKGSAKVRRQFVAANPLNMVQLQALYIDAAACQEQVETYTRRRLLIAKYAPHVWTWVAGAGFTTLMTGYLTKIWDWLISWL